MMISESSLENPSFEEDDKDTRYDPNIYKTGHGCGKCGKIYKIWDNLLRHRILMHPTVYEIQSGIHQREIEYYK